MRGFVGLVLQSSAPRVSLTLAWLGGEVLLFCIVLLLSYRSALIRPYLLRLLARHRWLGHFVSLLPLLLPPSPLLQETHYLRRESQAALAIVVVIGSSSRRMQI